MAKKKKDLLGAELGRNASVNLVTDYWYHRHGTTGQLTPNRSMYADVDLNELLDFLQRMKYKHNAGGVRLYYGAKNVQVNGAYTYVITPLFVTTQKGGASSKVDIEIFTAEKGIEAGAFVGYDFASLCPPDARHLELPKKSLAYDVYGAMNNPKPKSKKKNSR